VNRNLRSKEGDRPCIPADRLEHEICHLQAASGLPTAQKTDPITLADNQLVAKRFNEFQQGRPYVPVYDHRFRRA
jgi:hypothetical protein